MTQGLRRTQEPAARTVLLARPHPWIATRMQQVLGEIGFDPMPLATLQIAPRVLPREVAGAVLSTSVTSPVAESLGHVAPARLHGARAGSAATGGSD